jgi:glutamate-1-semialdehyde 2,1-aminomutase
MEGKKLWKRAIKSIPGGNGLLSKRPDRYAPDIWPTYFSKAKGTSIWDLEGNKYTDMAQMGIGTCILGYCDDDVDAKVKQAIDTGINTTLNCPEEVLLAEKLIELNPFAGGVKFARTGGEAMSIAIRIARTYSGKDKIAFSGYHGWSDWYLATNLNGDKLGSHLLPGLEPKGVPEGLQDTIYPFTYNNLEELELLCSNHDIGVIVIEGARYDFPTEDFLRGINKIAKEKNIVIVVDEITSGWRLTDGGVYKLYDFQPDIVVYGKALGNGYAISAIVGKEEIMNCAQDTFISSTFWTERVGFVAALSTIEKLTTNKVWEHLIDIGTHIGDKWRDIAKKHNLKIEITDFKPLITFKLQYGELNAALYTLFIQEMLKRKYIASNSVYLSYSHKDVDIQKYLNTVDEVFKYIKKCIDTNSVHTALKTKIKDEGFKRLN